MSQTWTVELFVYLIAALCALLILPRSANWRIRLIIGTIGMQALAQAVTQMRLNHPFWQTRLSTVAGVVELLAGALALTAIYLLKRENVERKSADAKLRLSEASENLVPASPLANRMQVGTNLAALTGRHELPVMPAKKIQAPNAASTDGARHDAASRHQKPDTAPPRNFKTGRRIPVSLRGRVTHLDGTTAPFECEIADISQGGARLRMPVPLPPTSLVKIEYRGFLFLGEVCRCEQSRGHFDAGVRFEHRLDLANLSRLLHEVGIEPRADPVNGHPAPLSGGGVNNFTERNASFSGRRQVMQELVSAHVRQVADDFVESLAASSDTHISSIAAGLRVCFQCDDSQCRGFGKCPRVKTLLAEIDRIRSQTSE